MKKFFNAFAVILIFTAQILSAQNLFTENFEIPDSVISSGTPGWAISNSVQTSGFFSDSTALLDTDTSILTTLPFSTLGSYSLKLKFNHIIYGDFFGGRILISVDNGNTWIQLGNNEYLGNAFNFAFANNFTSNDYSDWTQPQPCFNINPLNNSLFKTEIFDISGICANVSNVLVRFEASNDTSFSCSLPSPNRGSSWFVDDIVITGQPISLSSTDACSNDGTASVTQFFGTAPHTYAWSNGATTSNITNLIPGIYTITVTDNLGASATDSLHINPPFQLFTNIIQPQCPSVLVGQASVFALGGVAPFTYLWSNGQNTQTVNNLTPGVYSVTVTDAIGCDVIENITIQCASNVYISATASACSIASGSATVDSISNATPPFTYLWNTNPVQTTQIATGLNGNTLASVSITDANGDFYSGFVVIPFSDTVSVSATLTPSTCNSASGASTANASGGIPPYAYSWNTNPPQNTATANFLSAQTYVVTATDANGCTTNLSVSVPSVSTLNVNMSSTPTQCGSATGTASSTVSGGSAPYTYLWNTVPVQTTAIATNLSYGNYTVIITDNAICTKVNNVFVNSINSINISVSYPNTSCTCVNPTVNVTGGVAPYSYLWDDGTTNQTANCFSQGYHYVRVTDATGCVQTKGFYVSFSANCYITVNGSVFADINKNCIKDPGEYGIANTPVTLTSANQSHFRNTDKNGNYSFYVLNDTFQLAHTPTPNWFANCPTAPASYTVIAQAGSVNSFDFADTATTYFDDAEMISCAISGRSRGFNSNYYVTIKNNGTSQLNGTVSSIHDAALTYQNSIPLVSVYTPANSTAGWNYTNLNPGERRTYNLTTSIPPATPLGTIISNTSSVTSISTDVNPANNSCSRTAVVNGSYDPNDKITWPPNQINITDLEHQYLINFQNTGTSPAVRVIIEDTIDSSLDFSSISNIVGSHPFAIDSSQAPFIKFIFDNINLPDSNINEPESHGFVAFRIMRNASVAAGTMINNTAYIYFDFNSPIVTNTVVNTVVYTGIDDTQVKSTIKLYPNPSTGIVYIDYNMNTRQKTELQIFDVLNQLIQREEIIGTQGKLTVDLSAYSSGVYSYRIITKDRLLNSGKISLIR